MEGSHSSRMRPPFCCKEAFGDNNMKGVWVTSSRLFYEPPVTLERLEAIQEAWSSIKWDPTQSQNQPILQVAKWKLNSIVWTSSTRFVPNGWAQTNITNIHHCSSLSHHPCMPAGSADNKPRRWGDMATDVEKKGWDVGQLWEYTLPSNCDVGGAALNDIYAAKLALQSMQICTI